MDEHLRIGLTGAQVLVGRIGLDPGALLGDVRVAVFRDPAGAGQQPVEAQHVEQRHLDDRRVDQVRPLGQHRAHEQAALRPAHDPEMGLGGDPAVDQVERHSLEILVGALAVFLQGRLVPARAELAAPARIGHDIDAAALEPEPADRRRIAGQQGRLEAAVAVQQGRVRPIHRHVALVDHEIGDLRAVGRGRLELLDHHAGGVELGRQALDGLQFARGGVGQPQGVRRQIALDADEQLIVLAAGRAQPDRGVLGQVQALADPAVFRAVIGVGGAAHVLEQGDHQPVACQGHALDGFSLTGAQDQFAG